MLKLQTYLLIMGLVFVSCFVAQTAEARQSRPHIVLILVDDMGYGDPACYNASSKIATPHINSLARDGMRFTDAHAPGPLCHMSRYGLLTGRYPFRTNVGRWRTQPLINSNQETLPLLLQRAGYRTAMVGKWHLGFDEQGYDQPLPGGPVDRGFDTFFGIRASTDIPPYFYIRGDRAVMPPTESIEANRSEGWSPIQGAFWRAGKISPDLHLEEVLPKFTDEAVKVINTHVQHQKNASAAAPLFLYVALPAPHTPWLPDETHTGKTGAGMYGDFLYMVDTMVGRILSTLDGNKMTEETLVVFTSDNGPVWYDEDVERFDHDSAGGLRGMKADAWEAGHRMPMLVRWPGMVKSETDCHHLVCFTDFLATFAELVGQSPRDADQLDSISFLSALLDQGTMASDPSQSTRQQWLMESGNGMMTVRSGPWKLIAGLGSGGFSQPRRRKPAAGEPVGQLYHLGRDLAETTNLYDEKPDVVRGLRKLQP